MRTALRLFAALALVSMSGCVVVPVTGSGSAPAMQDVPLPGATASSANYAAQARGLLNAQRTSAGLPPLTENRRLAAAAEAHAADMARRRTLTHTGTGGTSVADRIRAQGYCFRMAAENIATGYRDLPAVIQGWMQSAGHRRNILSTGASEFGLGEAGGYWTLVLAGPC